MPRRPYGMFRRGSRWYFKYKDETGKWREHATHTSSLSEAITIRDQFLLDLQEGHLPNDRRRWTLKETVDDWLTNRKFRVAKGTFSSEQSITRTLLRLLGENKTLQAISEFQVIRRYESVRLESGTSPKTVNNEIMVLKGLLQGAGLWHRVAQHYKPLRVPKSDVGAALRPEETRRFVQTVADSEPNAAAAPGALVSLRTGMRSGEIRQLQLASIHLDATNPFLYVRRETTKTDRGARYVALDRIACWAFRKLLARAKKLGATRPEHYLFPTLRQKHTRQTDPLHGGKGYDPCHPQTSWGEEWNKARRRAGISHRRFHDLRHTYITHAAEAGVPLAVTQAQVGHMSVQMVEHYTHICQAAIHRAAEQIEKNSTELLSELGLSIDDHDCSPKPGL